MRLYRFNGGNSLALGNSIEEVIKNFPGARKSEVEVDHNFDGRLTWDELGALEPDESKGINARSARIEALCEMQELIKTRTGIDVFKYDSPRSEVESYMACTTEEFWFDIHGELVTKKGKMVA